MKYKLIVFKNNIENIVIYPFIVFGFFLFSFKKRKKSYQTFFFFPFYHAGGAEKVHLQITEAVGTKNSVIFFTRKSQDKTFLERFKNTQCDIKDISRFTDNKWLFFLNLIYRGYIAAQINFQNNTLIFNGQSNFGYKISSWINKKIIQVDLIHALNTFSYIRIPFIKNYSISITVSKEIIDKHIEIYKKKKIPNSLLSKFTFIQTRIDLPSKMICKDYFSSPLKILYVGRGTKEKRVHIIVNLAKSFAGIPSFEFHFAGDVFKSVPAESFRYCIFHGNISEQKDLNQLYNNCHILVLSSSTESGPLVIMEAMANGLAILTTDVGFVCDYVKNGINGCKIPPYTPEKEIVSTMKEYVEAINSDRNKLEQTGLLNQNIAYQHFGLQSFNKQYLHLFSILRSL